MWLTLLLYLIHFNVSEITTITKERRMPKMAPASPTTKHMPFDRA